ncbi:PTS beta-glucoside transporter subunit EIIBCA [Pseudoclavibacter sp. RFBJ3]|uniref:beta-glucoside-specific PTS transporter subunit IIABC n=1 Tax=unclassified Pseudoclavibacter TaxID=2615177 RepID=UPI000CE91638|nr:MULTISPECIES: beta-glucoside-specific PTS transporter subunit IIABC [unclassified Pseudoclavibacter]PPF87569.1 PTS beta-glucoside transporter subunit EIIBCA [Pseudoclavibacter sp. RFBJ5]PPF90419.1 PTS beta-glucoside transporter subunit EIIBCA [Pseudoclavibacter sp. RFBJ3]PPG01141.1 PTS beta-glucoside transporter subunit EIIBCA [Pseudoclavibacter sp. RFBH5]PPG26240.1 PTS beta-glucoside transporter subunit EIIBCA [Pseudoclavibacter sp. RFBI4]
MNISSEAAEILEHVGGSSNVSALQHCSTRLRFSLADDSTVDEAALKTIPGVLGVVRGPQTQVIVGGRVLEYYRAVEKLRSGSSASPVAEKPRTPWTFKRVGSKVLDFVVSVFVPIIPAIAGAGIFKSLLVLAAALGWIDRETDSYALISAVPDAVFAFLPLLVAYTTAKKLDVNRPVALGTVALLLFPAFTTLVTQEGGTALFGIPVPVVNYNSQVFPAILAVLLLWGTERFFTKFSWPPIRTFFVPLMCYLVVAPATVFLIGPFGFEIGDLFAGVLFNFHNTFGWIAVALLAAILPFLISVGMHKPLLPPTITTMATYGKESFYLTASLAHNISEAGASFAVALRTRNQALRAIAVSAGFSALFGVTEPALYGVTLQNRRALIAVLAGAITSGAYLGITFVDTFAIVSPGLASISMFIDSLDPWNLIHALIGLVIGLVVSFVVGVVLWKDSDSGTLRVLGETTEHSDETAPNLEGLSLVAPMSGEIVELASLEDGVFSSGVLGEGVAIRPSDGRVVAPVTGTVTSLMDSRHAIGIRTDDGIEVLVHVGMDTVALDGAPFTTHVAQGDRVEAGQHVIDADLTAIAAAGLDTITPVVVVNPAGRDARFETGQTVERGAVLITLTNTKETANGTV